MRCSRVPHDRGLLPDHVRLTGLVTDAGTGDGPIWIDVPEPLDAEAPDRLDAWLLWLLPHAFATQQELVLDGPVDRALLQNASRLMDIWSGWRPDKRPISVRAELADASATGQTQPTRTGLFFTAGADSFFTLLHHDAAVSAEPMSARRPVDDLIYVWGFDIPLKHRQALEEKHATLVRIAEHTQRTLVPLMTNLRETGIRQPWGPVMHGPALGGVGLLLGNRWTTVLLSTWDQGDPGPWGSTAITDPLFSTSVTQTEPYGVGYSRFDKIAYIARHEIALDTLHVCWQDQSHANCGQCEKCLRTLIALDLLGVRGRAASFPTSPLDLGRLAEVWRHGPQLVGMYEDLKSRASSIGRTDVVAAIDACLRGET